MDVLCEPRDRVRRRAVAAKSRHLPARLPARHPDRRAARHRTDSHHRDAAADHVRPRPAVLADHARRHLLRRAVRRLDHVDPGEHSGRGRLDRHLHRRPPDGEAGPGRGGARRRGARLVLRRLRRHRVHRGVRAAACRDRAGVQLAGLFLADGARSRHRGRAGARLGDQGDRHGAGRPAVRPRRHRREQRAHALHLRRLGTVGRHRLPAAGDRAVRHRRDHPQSRAARSCRVRKSTARMRDLWPSMQDFRDSWRAVLRGTGLGSLLGILPGGGAVLAAFASYTLEKKVAADPSPLRQGRDRGRGGAGSRPTTRRRRPRSFRCSRSGCRPTPSWR